MATPAFLVATFLAAALLFVLQPLTGAMLLPRFGGAPAVWTTCLLCFQSLLLLGYIVTDQLARRLTRSQHALVQIGILLVAGISLPPRLMGVEVSTEPALAVLMTLLASVGLPFLALAMMSPLLQRLSVGVQTDAAASTTLGVYRLYAASNAGSLLGLLAYPFLIEPWFRGSVQAIGWTIGYGLLIVLTAVCWRFSSRAGSESVKFATPNQRATASAITSHQRAGWIAMAFVPSSLLAACTTFLSAEILPMPLLWIAPLAVYLVTYILAFSVGTLGRWSRVIEIVTVFAVALTLWSTGTKVKLPTALQLALHLGTLFLASLVCHVRLAERRPSADRLTEFYVWLAVGGALGGAFNSLVAPQVFPALVEYPVSLILAAAIALPTHQPWRRQLTLAAVVGAITLAFALGVWSAPGEVWKSPAPWLFAFLPTALGCWRRNPAAIVLGLGLATSAYWWANDRLERTIFRTRTFFGVHRVFEGSTGRTVGLSHGTVIHGLQFRDDDPRIRRVPLSYYFPTGPIGQILIGRPTSDPLHVGLVGLGIGTLATYGRPGDRFDFLEIDPAVVHIARDSGFFTHLKESAADCRIILGDARLTLPQQPVHEYDLLVLDAFTGDSIPSHLLTAEAFDIYAAQLKSTGAIAIHLSSEFVDLTPVIAAAAERLGWEWRVQLDANLSTDEQRRGKQASLWAVVAPSFAAWPQVAEYARWVQPSKLRRQLWTDDHASLFGLFKTGGRQ